MSSNNSSYHIPFPKTFLTVNARPKQAAPRVQPATQPELQSSGLFLSNRPVQRHQSVSSVASDISVARSDASTISPPSSPPTKAVTSPISPSRMAFLALNTKPEVPPSSTQEMSAAERARRMSFEQHSFLSNRY